MHTGIRTTNVFHTAPSVLTIGTCVFTIGTIVLLMGTSVLSIGTSVIVIGTSVTAIGTSVLSIGTSVLVIGTSVIAMGTSVLLIGTPVLSIGTTYTLPISSHLSSVIRTSSYQHIATSPHHHFICASTTAILTIFIISRTEQPICKMWKLFFMPSSTGPMASMPASSCMSL